MSDVVFVVFVIVFGVMSAIAFVVVFVEWVGGDKI